MKLEIREIGTTDIKAWPLGLGSWAFGGRAYGPISSRVAKEIIAQALDLGMTFFDVAPNYGNGRAEALLGEALAGCRDRVVLCTKGGNGVQFGRVVKRFDDKFLDESLARSLRRLGTDYIDIYLLHNPPVQVLRDGRAFEWLDRQRRRGAIRHWGISAYDNHEDAQLALVAGARVIEARYNLLRSDLLPALETDLERARCGFVARSPLGSGLLTAKYGMESRFDPMSDHRARWSPRFLKSVDEALDEISWLVEEGYAGTIHEAAVRFAVHGRAVSMVIPGAKSAEQLKINFDAACKGPLPAEVLERISPTREKFHEEMGLH